MENNISIDRNKTIMFSINEFCRMSELSRPTVYALLHAEGFPALRVGRRWVIPARAAEAWLEKNIGRQVLDR